jgi:hypothetical protein
MQTHKQDPRSTIALEIKRAHILFSKDPPTIQHEIRAQSEVVAFWIIRERSCVLDVVHCLSEFATESIGAPHHLKQKIIGFMGNQVKDQNPPGLLARGNIFATQQRCAPTLDIFRQTWKTATNMTTFLPPKNDMEMLTGIPLICYIPGAWVPVFIHGTWNPPAAFAWIVNKLATWPANGQATVMPILDWLRLACMKYGRSVVATAALTSTLAMDWAVILADREYLGWSKQCIDGMLKSSFLLLQVQGLLLTHPYLHLS